MTGALNALRYRAGQFFAALRPALSADDWAQVEAVLGRDTPALALFRRMSAPDRRHAVAVLRTVRQAGEDHPALLQAALLHDVGKSLGLPLLHRVVIVLLNAFWPAALTALADAPLTTARWRRPFVVHARHPEIGARWAAQAGCDPLAVTLIRRHQQPPPATSATLPDRLHRALYRADGLN
ncbi:MAG: hypothetical protein D6796_05495 [Caldilineae bacterium]|nr:MAG: hypothetical protein D6796_05495 [Caldilineae bacterium]